MRAPLTSKVVGHRQAGDRWGILFALSNLKWSGGLPRACPTVPSSGTKQQDIPVRARRTDGYQEWRGLQLQGRQAARRTWTDRLDHTERHLAAGRRVRASRGANGAETEWRRLHTRPTSYGGGKATELSRHALWLL